MPFSYFFACSPKLHHLEKNTYFHSPTKDVYIHFKIKEQLDSQNKCQWLCIYFIKPALGSKITAVLKIVKQEKLVFCCLFLYFHLTSLTNHDIFLSRIMPESVYISHPDLFTYYITQVYWYPLLLFSLTYFHSLNERYLFNGVLKKETSTD